MAESLGEAEYGWFTPADLTQVVRAIHQVADWQNVILIGGQSLTAWVQHYQIELPVLEGPYLTADADFIAKKAQAAVIADYLDGTPYYPKPDDASPNTAVIDFVGAQGTVLRIDLLSGILGIDNEEVRKLAVPIVVEGAEDLPPITVLHPLLVLESRCANLERLSEKRNPDGVTQATVACLVAANYLEECLRDPGRRRESLKAAKRICVLARSSPGVYVYAKWKIDVLSIVDPERMPGRFAWSWRYCVLRANYKRAVAAKWQESAKD